MLGFNSDPTRNRPLVRLAAATALLALAANACSDPAPNIIARTAASGGLNRLPSGADCPKGGHPFEGDKDPSKIKLLMVTADIEDPNSALYAVVIEQSYDVDGTQDAVICGHDATPEYGFGEVTFDGKAVAAQKGFTAVITLS